MKKLKRIAASIIAMHMLMGTAFAETDTMTYKANMENGEVTVEEKNLIGEIDNSNLEVNVIKQQGETRTTIFTGKLKDYDNGRWINLDFSEIQFALIFDWDTMENEAICIVPITENSSKSDIETKIDFDASKTIYQNSVARTTSGDIKADISLLYDNSYSECVLNAGEDLTAEVKVENLNSESAADVSVMLALYDEHSKLIGIKMDSKSIAASGTDTIKPTITVSSDNTAASAKVMIWGSSNMMPYTNAITLTVTGSDFFGDDYNLAVNMEGRNSANGMINSENDIDIFEFKALKDGLYTFESYGQTDTYASLSNKTSPTTIIKSDDNGGADNNFRISATLEANNSYYLKVGGHGTGKYRLVSNYAIGNVFGTVSPVKATGDAEFDKIIESKCSLYTFDSNDFVAQMHLQEYTSENDEYARFSLIGVSAGEYLVKTSRPGYLSRYSKITLNDNAVDLGTKVLIAGDVNDDGIVDTNDLTLLRAALNSAYGDSNYTVNADFNGDKVIDSTDESLLNSNVGKTSNDYNENVNYITFGVTVNNYNAVISGKAQAASTVSCSVYRGDILVSDENLTCGADGSFETEVELTQTGTYTIVITSDNRAFDAVKSIDCN